MGINSGFVNQGNNSIAIGAFSGVNLQGDTAVSIGLNSGRTGQLVNSIALGHNAGDTTLGAQSVAIGHNAGFSLMKANSVAIGHNAGVNDMSSNSVAIGNQAGNTSMGTESVAIGNRAGNNNLGVNSIAIGHRASNNGGSFPSTIVINATGNNLNPVQASSTYIAPIRAGTQVEALHYDAATSEVTRSPVNTAIRFNGILIGGLSSSIMPKEDNTFLAINFTNDRIPPVGGGWDLVTGTFTAPRDCYMNFNWNVVVQASTNAHQAVIQHRKGLVAPYTYEYIWGINVLNSSAYVFNCYNLSSIFYVLAGEIVRVGIVTPNSFGLFGERDASISFSGYNID